MEGKEGKGHYLYMMQGKFVLFCFVLFVMLRSPKGRCFMLHFNYLWKALDDE
jgi:hypothetical protein